MHAAGLSLVLLRWKFIDLAMATQGDIHLELFRSAFTPGEAAMQWWDGYLHASVLVVLLETWKNQKCIPGKRSPGAIPCCCRAC